MTKRAKPATAQPPLDYQLVEVVVTVAVARDVCAEHANLADVAAFSTIDAALDLLAAADDADIIVLGRRMSILAASIDALGTDEAAKLWRRFTSGQQQ
jgi:hypothetical protein